MIQPFGRRGECNVKTDLSLLAAIGLLVAVAMWAGRTRRRSGGSRVLRRKIHAGSLTQGIPTRAATAPGGRAFAEQIRAISGR